MALETMTVGGFHNLSISMEKEGVKNIKSRLENLKKSERIPMPKLILSTSLTTQSRKEVHVMSVFEM